MRHLARAHGVPVYDHLHARFRAAILLSEQDVSTLSPSPVTELMGTVLACESFERI